MKKYFIAMSVLLLVGCSKAPITGRSQLLVVGKESVLSQSEAQYKEIIENSKVLNNSDSKMVKRVGNKIAKSVELFLESNPQYKGLTNNFNWEFNLIESDQINAWCMPGGKVAFYTGILPYTKTEEGLAVVMGHEIAHAVADHGRERMSQELIRQYGGIGVEQVLNLGGVKQGGIFLNAYGVASDLTILKYGRDHEKEADKLGLIFMSLAGYDPNIAVLFWERMARDKEEPVEFFSTHPNSDTRIELIKDYINSEEFKQYKR